MVAPASSTASSTAPLTSPDGEQEAQVVPAATPEAPRASLVLSGGDELVASFEAPPPEIGPSVELALSKDGRVRMVVALGDPDAPPICDAWVLDLRSIDLGAARGILLALTCRLGEDYFEATEHVVLFREPTGAIAELADLEQLYRGTGDALRSAMGACETVTTVRYVLTGTGVLERHVERIATWTDQGLDAALTRELKVGCRPGRTTRVFVVRPRLQSVSPQP
jgi:hypothetical protein